MKHLSKNIPILFTALSFLTLVAFLPGLAGADFQVAYTGSVEEKPAVAYNSQTGNFLVAYLIKTYDLVYGNHYELRCQLHNSDGTKNGGVLMPLGVGTHEALGRPALDYNPNLDRFFVAIPARQDGVAGNSVIGRFLTGSGASMVGPDWLFNDLTWTYYPAALGEDVNSLRVVCNTLLNEFMVTVQRTVPDIYPWPNDHRNKICAQRISYSSGVIGSVVELADSGVNGIDGHAIAYAPISGTTPAGGRYLFAYAGAFGGVQLLDSTGNSITGVPLNLGEPAGENSYPDIAYGEVDGKKRFLMVYSDEDNCRPGQDPCAGDPSKQWTGVWGAYIDPLVTSYGLSGNNTPFPISYIWSHLANRLINTPRVSYNPNHRSFAVVWREVPFDHANNDESLSHIRGNVVDYYVADGLYGSSVPLPASDSNVVISDVSGTCASGVPCYSDEDPIFPDVSASYGSSAVVVWHQTYSSTDLDVRGDFFSAYRAGDELAIDFVGTNGVWNVDTAGTWRLISGGNVETMASWANGLAMDFVGTDGVWNVDGTTWSQISGSDVETMVGWANGLAMDFGASGVWNVDPLGAWTPISGDAETMAAWAKGLALDFGASGVWNVDTSGTWTPISGDAETMAAWAKGLALDFGASGVWNVDTAGMWTPISGDAETMAGWANGLALDFGASGVWNVDTAGTWTPISGDAEIMVGWTKGLAIDFGPGLWNVDTAWNWSPISSGTCNALTDVDLY